MRPASSARRRLAGAIRYTEAPPVDSRSATRFSSRCSCGAGGPGTTAVRSGCSRNSSTASGSAAVRACTALASAWAAPVSAPSQQRPGIAGDRRRNRSAPGWPPRRACSAALRRLAEARRGACQPSRASTCSSEPAPALAPARPSRPSSCSRNAGALCRSTSADSAAMVLSRSSRAPTRLGQPGHRQPRGRQLHPALGGAAPQPGRRTRWWAGRPGRRWSSATAVRPRRPPRAAAP